MRDNKRSSIKKEEKKTICSFYVCSNVNMLYHFCWCVGFLLYKTSPPSTALELVEVEEIKATPECF